MNFQINDDIARYPKETPMIGFLTIVHILITVALCALVLVQDSKGGGALGIGGSGSNSLLGATGAQTLAAKLTKYTAILFAVSCVSLTYFLAHDNKSVVDQMGTATLTAPPAGQDKPAVPAVPGTETNAPAAAATAGGTPAAQPATAEKATTDKAPEAAKTTSQPAANDKK